MEKKFIKNQYQSQRNVILEMYRGSNFYSDPLQEFYNHESLLMLSKYRCSMFDKVDKRFETSKITNHCIIINN